jgi:hypothetical protein
MPRISHKTWALLFGCLLLHPVPPAGGADATPAKSNLTPPIAEPSIEPIPYISFGTFEGVGTSTFQYVVSDRAGLAQAVGKGIYPNEDWIRDDLQYQQLVNEGRLQGALDKFRPDVDPILAFYKWASLKGAQNQGLRLFNIARSYEAMDRPWQAVKAYYAVVVHFPKSVLWSNGTPWYIAVSALDSIDRLLNAHPDWNMSLENAEIRVVNGFDQKGTNDLFVVNPGSWTARAQTPAERPAASNFRTLYQRGSVKFVRWTNGDFQMMVHDRPFLVRGISYFPTPVGKSPDYGYKAHVEWMTSDDNGNRRIDGPYDSWVDVNGNNKQDADERAAGDFRLMRELGVNTIRLYHQAVNKALLRDLNDTYGIRVLMGDLVGAYTVGSGARWEDGTNYSDPKQRERMRESVRQMVEAHKDEDYVLMWVLGNENNYGVGNSARKDPRSYYRFVNSLARMIHIIDPSRPVAICNGDQENLDLIARECPEVDVLAVNAYRGGDGMGKSFWANMKSVWNKPVLISEFGCPAYNAVQSAKAAEETQAAYLVTNWKDIESHAAGAGTGNALGGVVFEWMDEWWKAGPQYDASIHDKVPQTQGAFHGGWMYEEWLGLASNGDGENSPFLRQLRPAYFALKNGPWQEPLNFLETSAFDTEGKKEESSEN